MSTAGLALAARGRHVISGSMRRRARACARLHRSEGLFKTHEARVAPLQPAPTGTAGGRRALKPC